LRSDRLKADRLAKYFAPTAVTFNAVGTYGNSSRNFLRGMSSFNVRRRRAKAFAVTERVNVMLRAEFFNLLNHPNFGLPGSSVACRARWV
jgi:hypothetical protein